MSMIYPQLSIIPALSCLFVKQPIQLGYSLIYTYWECSLFGSQWEVTQIVQLQEELSFDIMLKKFITKVIKNEVRKWEKKTYSKMMTYKYIWNVASDNTSSFSHEEIVCTPTLTFYSVFNPNYESRTTKLAVCTKVWFLSKDNDSNMYDGDLYKNHRDQTPLECFYP
jgi:hypothetical protein